MNTAESIGVCYGSDHRIEAWVERQGDLFGGYDAFLTLHFDLAPGPMIRTLGLYATTAEAIGAAHIALLEIAIDDVHDDADS